MKAEANEVKGVCPPNIVEYPWLPANDPLLAPTYTGIRPPSHKQYPDVYRRSSITSPQSALDKDAHPYPMALHLVSTSPLD
jgi:hypothetical protein